MALVTVTYAKRYTLSLIMEHCGHLYFEGSVNLIPQPQFLCEATTFTRSAVSESSLRRTWY